MSEIDDMISGGAGVGALGGPGGIPSNFSAETAENDQEIEMQFAVVCFEQAETYLNLLKKIKPSHLKRLTKHDDEIYTEFLKAFPELADETNNSQRLRQLNEEEMKSPQGKQRWRQFMLPFEKKIDDYNFGTLIRANVEEDYTEKNSIFGYRTQFYAIEIARNRRGLNDHIWETAQKEEQEQE